MSSEYYLTPIEAIFFVQFLCIQDYDYPSKIYKSKKNRGGQVTENIKMKNHVEMEAK